MKKSKRQQRLAEEREQAAHASEARWLWFMELSLLSLAIIFYVSLPDSSGGIFFTVLTIINSLVMGWHWYKAKQNGRS